jgi:hypothetical protein
VPKPARWSDLLRAANNGGDDGIFDSKFVDQWDNRTFDPTAVDREAAARLHLQLISRITTQRLPYVDGEEAAALDSVYRLFGEARETFKAGYKDHPESTVTEAVVWYVLNTHVRPFTAKWHRQNTHGGLAALDATDLFRHELAMLQKQLTRFDALLMAIRDATELPQPREPAATKREADIAEEMAGDLPWGIHERLGGLDATTAQAINMAEHEAVLARRRHYATRSNLAPPTDPNQKHAAALAISGGGIRSATFALGVLAALARRNLLYQFDYLSTVSGGGYLGAFLSTYLSAVAQTDGGDELGLAREDLPFLRKEGEAAALRHVRHHSKYLATGRLWERLQMAFAQVYGMAMNGLGFAYLAFVAAFAEYLLRLIPLPYGNWTAPVIIVALALATTPFVVPLIRKASPSSNLPDNIVAGLFVALAALLAWHGSGLLHARAGDPRWLILLAAIPLLASAVLALASNLPMPIKLVLLAVAAIAAPVLFIGIELSAYRLIDGGGASGVFIAIAVMVAGLLLFWRLFDINFTAPHRLYKKKLGEAYLVQPPEKADAPLRQDVSLKLSACNMQARAPYHLVNGALNVPGSQNSRMQGRLTDFFLFSRDFCGSPLTGYRRTADWEALDGALDLGTAMAISGAAAAPQMGLGTIKNLSLWLALFNVRLGYWMRNPMTMPGRKLPPPGLTYLLQEMLGWANERRPYINVSDGGHIENLGVYELLRRRCKYIVAIDGEQDETMTFQGLTTLLRLAYIDLGITVDAGLDALRLAASGLSRSHFAFCRIRYPRDERDGAESYGYLLYLKLSLTGNEGEFIRRYRLDEPAFPHTSTANQFFSEAQFEAYRSLGEHVGDKMFLPAIVGDTMAAPKADIVLEKWFAEIGKNTLEPMAGQESPRA